MVLVIGWVPHIFKKIDTFYILKLKGVNWHIIRNSGKIELHINLKEKKSYFYALQHKN